MTNLRLIVKYFITYKYRCLSRNKHQTFLLWNGKPVRWLSNRKLVFVSFKAFHTFTSQSSTLPPEERANPVLGNAAARTSLPPCHTCSVCHRTANHIFPPPTKTCFREIAMKCKAFSLRCVKIGRKSERIVMWHVWYYFLLHSTLSILSTPKR